MFEMRSQKILKNQEKTWPMSFKKAKTAGFTLIEALTVLFIFAIITVTFYSTWTVGTRYIIMAKNRFIALSLASEKMEVVRNLAYEKIAHTGDTPPGNIQQDEDITRSGWLFHVHTDIRNEDDPLDGTISSSPQDVDFIDYKNVRIEVSWENGTHNVVLVSRFVPAGIEGSAANKGVLIVNVYSDQSHSSVADSTVTVTNSATGFHETSQTDAFGRLMLVGLLESTEKYKIALTKGGYETVETLPAYPATPYNPIDTHASVVRSAINTIDLIQNKTAVLGVKTINYSGESVDNINFYLVGGRKLGTEEPALLGDPTPPVYNLDSHTATGSNGEKNFGAVSPGQYAFTLEESDYELIGLDPASPLALNSDQTLVINAKVGPKNVTSLLVKVKKDETALISGASVHLTKSGYDETLTTADDGMAFFPKTETPIFEDGTYDLSIAAEGFQDYSGQVVVGSNDLKVEEITLQPAT
jgi:type II secretory pathway pseudopilin PulG